MPTIREEILQLKTALTYHAETTSPEFRALSTERTSAWFEKLRTLTEKLPSFHEIKIGQQKFYEYQGRGSEQNIYMRVFPLETNCGTINAFCVEGPNAGFHYYFSLGEKVSPI